MKKTENAPRNTGLFHSDSITDMAVGQLSFTPLL
jgi:hypothetical protein